MVAIIKQKGFGLFSKNILLNNYVRSMTPQPDGKVILTGGFKSFGGVSVSGILRLNADGTLDTAFKTNNGVGTNGQPIERHVLQPDGKIIIIGSFQWNGSTPYNLARLNSDGTVDSTFMSNVGVGTNETAPSSIALQSDGKIIVVGGFTTWNGQSAIGAYRMNSDGTKDNSFTSSIPITPGYPGGANYVGQLPNGKLIISGYYYDANWNYITYANIYNTDGSFFSQLDSTVGSVSSLIVQSDGKYIVLGSYYDTNFGTTTYKVIRFNSDGTKDQTFNSNIGTGPTGGEVMDLRQQADGKIIIVGGFTSWNGTSLRGLVRLNTDGTRDTVFTTNNGPGISPNTTAYCVGILSDGKMFIGGNFTTFNNLQYQYLVQLNSDGTLNTTLFKSAVTAANNGSVSDMAVQADGKIIAVGDFTTWNNIYSPRIIRLNSDGSRDDAFMVNIGTGPGSTVKTVTIQPDGKILVGGFFTNWNGTSAINRITRLNSDGTRDTAFTTSVGTASNNGSVNTIALRSDNTILVGGSFTTWNGTTGVNRIVLLKAAGNRDTSVNFGGGANGEVVFIKVQSASRVLIGGYFTTWAGVASNYFVRLSDLTRDTAFMTNVGTAANWSVNTIAVQSDSKILIGGGFATWNGAAVNRIVRLNSDGTRDTAFTTNNQGGSDGDVSSIALKSDGKILMVGYFTSFGGVTVNKIVQINTDGTRDDVFKSNTGSATTDGIVRVVIQPDGRILLGGGFLNWDNNVVSRFIRISNDGSYNWQQITQSYVKVSGTWRPVTSAFTKIAGVWRQW